MVLTDIVVPVYTHVHVCHSIYYDANVCIFYVDTNALPTDQLQHVKILNFTWRGLRIRAMQRTYKASDALYV